MDRRTFNKLTGLAAAVTALTPAINAQDQPEEWKAGQDSPVHDVDRRTPLSGREVVLENEQIRIAFDQRSGALTEFTAKKTGWHIQRDPKLAQSFRVFAPTPDRSFNPIVGAHNRLASATRSPEGRTLTLVWGPLQSEYSGQLDITLTGTVTLDEDAVRFDMAVKNDSGQPVASVEWPVLGALGKPQGSATMKRMVYSGGPAAHEVQIYPKFQNEFGFCSTNCPQQLSAGRYKMLVAEREGLYIGNHTANAEHVVKYSLELQPGFAEARWMSMPAGEELDGHAVRIVSSVQQFPFLAPGQSGTLATIVMHPFSGDWHKGADFYRRWFDTWYKRPANPKWLDEPHAWQQIQINSSEEDLRTRYKDFPRRALQAAKAGIQVIQLTGWTKDGQDHGNPTQDIEPRLGTHEELKEAIARVEKMGVRVVLFNKFNYADTSTDWYRSALHKNIAMDPNDVPYVARGYKYQTPMQLADMNTRRFAVACMCNEEWRDICLREFQKSLDLGASGILADEVSGHGGWDLCFSKDHGHPAPHPLWSGDLEMGKLLREKVRQSRGEENFLLSGETLWDLLTGYYSLSYVRLVGEHTPITRYSNPRAQIMIAVTGFEDRDMINCALRYRYVMSFEPYNFKGNVDDFPTSMTYGEKMDAFRKRYRSYVWDGEFRDNQDAEVMADGRNYEKFAVFVRADGKRGAVVVNEGKRPVQAGVSFAGGNRSALAWASPEKPESHPFQGQVQIPARSAVLVMET